MEKPRHIWGYDTRPRKLFDRPFRIIAAPFMNLVASGKISHTGEWPREDYRAELEPFGITLAPDPTAFEKKNLLDKFRMEFTPTAWKTLYVLGLDIDNIDLKTVLGWHYAYHLEGQLFIERLRIIFNPRERVRLMVGPRATTIFGIDLNDHPLPIKVEGPTSRQDPLYKNLLLI